MEEEEGAEDFLELAGRLEGSEASAAAVAQDHDALGPSDGGPGPGTKKRKKARTSTSRPRAQAQAQSQPSGSRLGELARPRQRPVEPLLEATEKEKEKEKDPRARKPQTVRPSLLVRLRPTNLEEAMEAFFQSGFAEAPQFTYAHPDPVVAKYFQENSKVCFELLPEAQRILQRVQEEYGGPEQFMQRLYGDSKIGAEDLRDTIGMYLQEHGLEDKVEIRIVDNMLAVANVVKPSPDEKYIVNIARGQISKTMVQGICDHEVGTHLLRMMNDEYQVWHGCRDRYRLLNPWTTEEGFATLNTYISMPCKLLYPQALRYYAVCRGAQVGFVELFHELRQHVGDPKRCWQMCCRIKRGMHDTSQPGAFYMDQAYFKGAVEILRHLSEIDFGRLYGGQIALQDMDKVYFLLRKDVVRLPRFLNTPEKLKVYLAHCRRLIKENQIEAAVERVCRPIFIRAAKDFFPSKQKMSTQKLATLSLEAPTSSGTSCPPAEGRGQSQGRARVLDLSRLEDLARPRRDAQELEARGPSPGPPAPRRDCDLARLAELALPRGPPRSSASQLQAQAQDEAAAPTPAPGSTGRAPDLARLLDLARPRQWTVPAPPIGPLGGTEVGSPFEQTQASTSKTRSHVPRGRSAPPRHSWSSDRPAESEEHEAGGAEAEPPVVTEPRPPPDPPRLPDLARLAALAAPRKVCTDKSSSAGCSCLPNPTAKKRRRSKLRLLALVQKKVEDKVDLGESFLSSSQETTWHSNSNSAFAEAEEEESTSTSMSSFQASVFGQRSGSPAQRETACAAEDGVPGLASPRERREAANVLVLRSQPSEVNADANGPVAEAQTLAEAQPEAEVEVGVEASLPLLGQDSSAAEPERLPQAEVSKCRKRPPAIRRSSRPRMSLPSTAAMALPGSDGRGLSPTWKVVPIKTMQLQLSL